MRQATFSEASDRHEQASLTLPGEVGPLSTDVPELQALSGRIREWVRPGDAPSVPGPPPDVPLVVSAAKASAAYLAHTYHTKVPPEVVEQYTKWFSFPGEVVLDPFSGSGMVGVGALRAGRKALLVDLSPFAAFLSDRHCSPVPIASFWEAVKRVERRMAEEAAWLYQTSCRRCHRRASLEKAIWTEVMACPHCGAHIPVFSAALSADRRIQQTFSCPVCAAALRRGQGPRVGWRLAAIYLDCPFCGPQSVEAASEDHEHVAAITQAGVPSKLWYPSDPIKWGDMWRRGYHDGVERVSDFYTVRNLRMLAGLRAAIAAEPDPEIRRSLTFVFTNLVWHGSRMRRFNARGGARPMNGALYIPAVFEEANLLRLWRHKASMVAKHLAAIRSFNRADVLVAVGSATDLSAIPDDSIDYVFTDPPYGGNILYSEVNLIWEAWFEERTDSRPEVVISRSQNKGLEEYRLLLARAFSEIHRVLRPGRWLTLTFNTSHAAVWQALQSALLEAGFTIHLVQVLDKGHRSFKQLTSNHIAGYDVLITAQKGGSARRDMHPVSSATLAELSEKLRARSGPIDSLQALQQLYAHLVASFLREGKTVPWSIADVAKMI